jgi:hypothetical protein
MIRNELANRLNNLAVDYSMRGDLGANSRKAEITSEDFLTLGGMALAVDHFSQVDGTAEDLDPTPGSVKLAGNKPGDEVTAEYEIHGNRTLARMEAVEGEEHYSWSLGMDDNQATLVVLEDKGDSFLATAMSVFPDETKNSKVVRSGSWDELPDALSFGLIAG